MLFVVWLCFLCVPCVRYNNNNNNNSMIVDIRARSLVGPTCSIAAPSVARSSQLMELNGINMNHIESCMIVCVSMFKLFFVVYCTPNLAVTFDVFDVGQVLISTKFTNISLQ